MKHVVVIGATGLVGGGITKVLSQRGHRVYAIGRNRAALEALRVAAAGVITGVWDVATDQAAAAAASAALEALGSIDAVITSVNPPRATMSLRQSTTAQFERYLQQSVLAHFCAARSFIPVIADEGAYVAIGGSSADFVWPSHGHISTAQAAQRMMLNVLAAEWAERKVAVRNFMIGANVHDGTDVQGVSTSELGKQLADLIADPAYGGRTVIRYPHA